MTALTFKTNLRMFTLVELVISPKIKHDFLLLKASFASQLHFKISLTLIHILGADCVPRYFMCFLPSPNFLCLSIVD